MRNAALRAPAGFVLLFAITGWSQEFRGTLSGRVIDQQQAGVPNAKIAATAIDTRVRSQTVSGPDGSYDLPFLPPGPYTITAEAAGFKRYVNDKVRVTTNERGQLDIPLEIGGGDQTILVTAESSLLE